MRLRFLSVRFYFEALRDGIKRFNFHALCHDGTTALHLPSPCKFGTTSPYWKERQENDMRLPAIYLETTIFNFPFADDAPQYRADTLKLFEEIKAGKFKPFTSVYVLDELENTIDEEKREKMKALVADCNVEILPVNEDAERLARIYVNEKIITAKYETDALHIAAASVADLDFIVSLNFKHIVKRKTMIQTEIINAREGYRRVYIHTPMEVIDYDEDA